MANIYDKAKELGQMIQNSPEMAAMAEADKKQLADPQAQEMIKAYNLVRMNLARKAQSDNITKEEMDKIRQELTDEFTKLTENQNIAEYVNAKRAFDTMITAINDILSRYITGDDQPHACTSDCSTCGGCH